MGDNEEIEQGNNELEQESNPNTNQDQSGEQSDPNIFVIIHIFRCLGISELFAHLSILMT